jgi:hypothetical protein
MGVETAVAVGYYGPEIVSKMRSEIDRIAAKAPGPYGVQYSLQATRAGSYPCYTCSGGTINLQPGDIWKYGETTNPNSRYSGSYLNSMGLRFVPEFPGSTMGIKIAEKGKIYGYFFLNGHLPGGNKIFR